MWPIQLDDPKLRLVLNNMTHNLGLSRNFWFKQASQKYLHSSNDKLPKQRVCLQSPDITLSFAKITFFKLKPSVNMCDKNAALLKKTSFA